MKWVFISHIMNIKNCKDLTKKETRTAFGDDYK